MSSEIEKEKFEKLYSIYNYAFDKFLKFANKKDNNLQILKEINILLKNPSQNFINYNQIKKYSLILVEPFEKCSTRGMEVILSSMEEILKKLLIINSGPEEDPDFTFDKLFGTKKSGMYVLSNTKNFNGSAVMLYKDVLKDIATALGNVDLYIIPSSVHELIILPDLGTMDKKALTAMVRDVNASEVAESEILSDHAYFYNHEEGKLYA